MSACECLPRCPFFNDKMANMPASANILKSKYCQKDFIECARYMIFKKLGREKVPQNLFPNMQEKAREIISRK